MDTGHNKNVANFETVIIILTNLGAAYAPPQALIFLAALRQFLEQLKAAVLGVNEAEADKTVAVDNVQAEFRDLPQFVVNVKRQAEIEVNDPAFTKDIQTIVNKFSSRGRATGIPDDPSTPDVDESRTSHSDSQRSRDSQIAHLAELSALLKTRAEEYKATGTPYATDAIDDRIAALTAANNAATAATAAYGTKIDARDALLYDDKPNCLMTRITLIKSYVALTFGKNSAPYKQIAALEFRRVK